MNDMVNMMREHVPSETRIHYIITSGGDFNRTLYEWIDTESTTYKENEILRRIQKELEERLGQK